ncbi:hypothetical protein BC833DRAFT_610781, partial [Globomyces pollinis-pini]
MSYYPVNQQQQQLDLNFQQFQYGQNNDYNQFDPPVPSHDIPEAVSWKSIQRAFSTGGFDNEPPLLEELGINFSHILSKGITVLNPFSTVDRHIMDDTDLMGPIIFYFLLGGFLLLSGKIHFGYIYGLATLGCLLMYAILNLMSTTGIDAYQTASVLGYSLLPIVILSSISIFVQMTGAIGLVASVVAVFWCAYSASAMFVSVLELKEQR